MAQAELDGHFETSRAADGTIRQRCSFDDLLFDTWEDAWQHMVDEHGWDRESWERRKEITALVDSVAHWAEIKGDGWIHVGWWVYDLTPECTLPSGNFRYDRPTADGVSALPVFRPKVEM